MLVGCDLNCSPVKSVVTASEVKVHAPYPHLGFISSIPARCKYAQYASFMLSLVNTAYACMPDATAYGRPVDLHDAATQQGTQQVWSADSAQGAGCRVEAAGCEWCTSDDHKHCMVGRVWHASASCHVMGHTAGQVALKCRQLIWGLQPLNSLSATCHACLSPLERTSSYPLMCMP